MLNTVAKKITGWCISNDGRSDQETKVVQYGIELFLEFITKFILILFIGTCIGKFQDTVLGLLVFMSIRSQAGGKHVESNLGCTVCMVIIWGMGILAGMVAPMPIWIWTVCLIFSIAVLVLYSPRETAKSMHLEDEDRKRRRTWGLVISLSWFGIAVLPSVRNVIVISIIIEMLTLFQISKKEKEKTL